MENEQENIIIGRPDFADNAFGKTELVDYPTYVFGLSKACMLVHKVARVTAHWYSAHYDRLYRHQSPKLVAETVCGKIFFIQLPGEKIPRATFCDLPKEDAVPCGRCHGQPATFGKHGTPSVSKEMAKIRLGCAVRGRKAVRP